jgi:zinc protease
VRTPLGKTRTACLALLVLMLGAQAYLYPQVVDRSSPPELGPPPSMHLPAIEQFKLSNGLDVTMMEKHDVPLVQINLIIKTGSAMDPSNKGGVATMTADMLDEGAGGRNALELADAVDYLGADLFASAGYHTTVVGLFTPLSKLDSAMALLADVVLRPDFPKEELERLKKDRMTTFLQWRDQPQAISAVVFNSTLFGQRHPYGTTSLGTEASVRSLTVRDLERFHQQHYRPNNAMLVVVGDMKVDQMKAMLEGALGEWKGGSVASVNWPQVPQVEQRIVYLVDKPGSAQSVIRIGRIGVARTTKDYFPLQVLNTVLGGSFASRLNQNLREEHGYTYGAGSVFDMRPLPGPFLAASSVQTDVTDKALVEFMKELGDILKPVPAEELERAKNYLALGYPENFQSVGQIASQLGEMVLYRLPEDYFNTYIPNVLSVTGDEVAAAAQTYLDPAKMIITVVGDRAVIEKGIQALNLGRVEVLSIDEVLGKAPKL